MLLIGYSSVRIVLGFGKFWNYLLVSSFLISQAIFGKCVITFIENIVRSSNGYITTSNEFILHNIVQNPNMIWFLRVIFLVLGVMLYIDGKQTNNKEDGLHLQEIHTS